MRGVSVDAGLRYALIISGTRTEASTQHVERRCGRVTHSLFAESKKEANQAINSHVSLLKSLNQGGKAGVGYFFASESSPNTSCVRGCGAEVFIGYVRRDSGKTRLNIKSLSGIGSRKLTHCLSSRRR